MTIRPSLSDYRPSSKELDVIHIPTHSLAVFEARLPRLISVSQIVCTELAKDESQSSCFVLTSALAAWWCFGLALRVCGFQAACVFSSFFHLVFAGHQRHIKRPGALWSRLPTFAPCHYRADDRSCSAEDTESPAWTHMRPSLPLPMLWNCLSDVAAFCRNRLHHGFSLTHLVLAMSHQSSSQEGFVSSSFIKITAGWLAFVGAHLQLLQERGKLKIIKAGKTLKSPPKIKIIK